MMNRIFSLAVLLLLLIGYSCSSFKKASRVSPIEKELNKVVELMSGTFSSRDQAASDSLFYDINLVMFPIWEKDKEAKWLYVEQAVTQNLMKPYRQRVYRISKTEGGAIESRVYELQTPADYIHGWEKPEMFDGIDSSSLKLREGCAVFLSASAGGCYAGSTNDKDCSSTLRGASYATSIVSVCADEIVSWDQGWDSSDSQVWGAETEGYVFKRLK